MEIRIYPDPVLRAKAEPVALIDENLRILAETMIETMYASDGVGLAAPQVGRGIRLVVLDIDPEARDPRVLINPVIRQRSRAKATCEEGCLSLPGINARVSRPAEVTVEAQDLEGNVVEYAGGELLARALQHEIDHLDGVLFIDRVSPTARFHLRGELERLKTSYEARVAAK